MDTDTNMDLDTDQISQSYAASWTIVSSLPDLSGAVLAEVTLLVMVIATAWLYYQRTAARRGPVTPSSREQETTPVTDRDADEEEEEEEEKQDEETDANSE